MKWPERLGESKPPGMWLCYLRESHACSATLCSNSGVVQSLTACCLMLRTTLYNSKKVN